ncbi:hypothetical protein BVX95_02150 [archaeon D22]|nr:hypothetical protein BVX95_02150 [archaeon D22]
MKMHFFEAKDDLKTVLPEELIKKLPKNIILFTTVQHIGQLENIKRQLSDFNVKTEKVPHTKYEGQILGCSIKKIDDSADAFLYIGDGEFHPKALVLKNEKPVIAYNPYTQKIREYHEKDIGDLKKKQKAGLVKFHVSDNIGVLVTLKPGQNRLKRAQKLKEKFPDKNFYILVADTIDFGSLEDFNYIDCFVNTACPRIGYDDTIKIGKPVINLEELDELTW